MVRRLLTGSWLAVVALLAALGSTAGLAACAGTGPPGADAGPADAASSDSASNGSSDTGARDATAEASSDGGLTAPTRLIATAGDATVSLRWNPTTAGTTYRVYRSTASGTLGAMIATSATEQHVDTTVANATTYWYTVTAVRDGAEGPASTQVPATPKAPLPPALTGLTAVAGDASVALAWTPMAGATYNVQRSLSATTPGTLVGASAVERYTDATAANGTTYWYTVSAVVGGSEGPVSAPPVSATPRAARLGKIIFYAGSHSGDFANDASLTGANGIARADSLCMKSSHVRPGTTFKALLVDGVHRDAVALVDWVLQPDTKYYQTNGLTLIAQTSASAVFDVEFSNLTNPISPGTSFAWTGIGSNQWAAGNHCNGWSTSATSVKGHMGVLGRVTAQAIGVTTTSQCGLSQGVFCVEQ
ncbi:MAG: DUF1554 domain-containing protein [Myxococcales bacterium]|nr:DUF1554 domain-containing protein [Myxococcales bacterium]